MTQRARGFTLPELMTVVVIVGLFATLAVVSFGRTKHAGDLDAFTNDIRDAVVIARRRAVATGSTYLVDVRTSSVSWCQQDPNNLAQAACPSVAPYESGHVMSSGPMVQATYYAVQADIGGGAAQVPIGGGRVFLFDRKGTASSAAVAIPTGFSVYLQGVAETAKQTKVVVYPAAARPRIIDHW